MYNRVLNKLPRTNNNLEGWYTRFSTMFRQTHPSIWEFIDTLKLDASHNLMLIVQMLADAFSPSFVTALNAQADNSFAGTFFK